MSQFTCLLSNTALSNLPKLDLWFNFLPQLFLVVWYFHVNTQKSWLVLTRLLREHFFHDYTATSQRKKQVWQENHKRCCSKEQLMDIFTLGAKVTWLPMMKFEINVRLSTLFAFLSMVHGEICIVLYFIWLFKSFLQIWIWSSCVISSLSTLKRWIFSPLWKRSATFRFNICFCSQLQDLSIFSAVRLT